MLTYLLICLIFLFVFVCIFYGGRRQKDFVRMSITALAGLGVVGNSIPMAVAQVNNAGYRDAKSAQHVMPRCDAPITTFERNSLGCSGGCVSDSSIVPLKICNYDGPKECVGTLKQKIQRIVSISHARHQSYRVGDADGHPEFHWPARGRIIQEFANGGDGINIALAEGTQVKAVEEGEVAFAGGELKGYGNMILIRHPNGYVSAYAHNSELKVAKGDKVARGQIIALSGQTGSVSSPQLHFELRKGSTPINPMTYLAGL